MKSLEEMFLHNVAVEGKKIYVSRVVKYTTLLYRWKFLTIERLHWIMRVKIHIRIGLVLLLIKFENKWVCMILTGFHIVQGRRLN